MVEKSVNMWTGYTDDFDPSGVIQLKGIVKDDSMFVGSLRRHIISYYAGISVLENGGSLSRHWDDIEDELIEKGKIAIVEYGRTNKKFLADIITDEYNILKGIARTTLALVDNPDIKFTTDPRLYTDTKESDRLSKHYMKLDEKKFVIFKNNKLGTPFLQDFDYYAQKIVNVIRKMEMDMFLSEKKLMFFVDEQPDEEDVKYLVNTFQKGVFLFPNFQYSSNPSKAGQKEGKTGINPHNVKFELYEPKTDFTDRYIKKFNFWWDKLMLMSGVRYDVISSTQAEGGAERATSGQVRASGKVFDAFERRAWKARMLGITDYQSKFEPDTTPCQLIYGEYNKEKNRML